MKNLKWKKSYGDGEYTEDRVLWSGNIPYINEEGDEIVISGDASSYFVVFFNDNQKYICDTLKEAKEFVEQDLLPKVLK